MDLAVVPFHGDAAEVLVEECGVAGAGPVVVAAREILKNDGTWSE